MTRKVGFSKGEGGFWSKGVIFTSKNGLITLSPLNVSLRFYLFPIDFLIFSAILPFDS